MKKEKFIKKVQKELDNIKAKATPEEIAKLEFKKFQHDSGSACIYGLMTGDCDSDRALEIQPKKYADIDGCGWDSGYEFEKQSYEKGTDFTALEKYLFMVERPKHKEIIKYLKGKTDSVNLELV